MNILVVTNQYPTRENPHTNPAVYYQVQGLRALGLNVDVLHVDRVGAGPLAYLREMQPLYHHWQTGSYDLLHVQFGGLLALLGTLIAGKRTVITYHGTDLHGGHPVNLAQRLKARVNVVFSRLAARLAGQVIVVAASLLPHLPRKARRHAQVLLPGVDYEVFAPRSPQQARRELGLSDKTRYILFSDISGSPVKRRGLARQTVELVKQTMPDAQLLLMSAQPYWRVPVFLYAADCLLLTSEKEGSPNIVKEALATNLPVVSVDVGDVADRCAGVANCQIVADDAQALVQAIVKALTMRRADGGREIKRSELDNHIVCQRLLTIYQTTIEDT